MFDIQLQATARALVARGKGILAADESTGTMEKRFKSVGVACTEENRRAYRELVFTTPGLGEFISGVILFDETIRQKAADNRPLVEVLHRQGIIPGIKVDKGAKALAGFAGEKITEGLDGLRERLVEYRELGARFTKWRAVISIAMNIPTDTCLRANAQALARFAALSQEAGLVPIVEPEVLMDGDHEIGRHGEVTQRDTASRLRCAGRTLHPSGGDAAETEHGAVRKRLPATGQCVRSSRRHIALHEATVPAAVPGLVFLSGGQNDVRATEHLNAMNQAGRRAVGTELLVRTRLAGAGAQGVGRQIREHRRGAESAAASRSVQWRRAIRKIFPMKSKTLLLFTLALGGCVPSWNSFYTEKDIVFDPALVGTWRPVEAKETSKETWEFSKTGEKLYQLAQTDEEGRKAAFEARLFKLKDHLFLESVSHEGRRGRPKGERLGQPLAGAGAPPVKSRANRAGTETRSHESRLDEDISQATPQRPRAPGRV